MIQVILSPGGTHACSIPCLTVLVTKAEYIYARVLVAVMSCELSNISAIRYR